MTNHMNDFFEPEPHIQFHIIKKHIERAVQDLFLDSLRKKNSDLLYIFNDEEQIDFFIERILKYWENLENYENCKEVLLLSNDFKERWKNKGEDLDSAALDRINELFKTIQ